MAKFMMGKSGRVVRLGRVKPREGQHEKSLKLSMYLGDSEAKMAPPEEVNWSAKAAASIAQMFLNNELGCCVVADHGHLIGIWTGNDSDSGGIVIPTDAEIKAQYFKICGPNDQGCNIGDFCDYIQKYGFIANGKTYKIDGRVLINSKVPLEVKLGIYLFGGVKLGINLPQEWLDSHENGVWEPTNSDIVGGHDVLAVGYNKDGVIISTWGGKRLITWAAMADKRFVEESHVCLSPQWYGNDKIAPCGINVDRLKDDMQKLANGIIPDAPPAPTPTPVTPPSPQPTPSPSPVPQVFTASGSGSGTIIYLAPNGVRYQSPCTLSNVKLTLKAGNGFRSPTRQEMKSIVESAGGLAKISKEAGIASGVVYEINVPESSSGDISFDDVTFTPQIDPQVSVSEKAPFAFIRENGEPHVPAFKVPTSEQMQEIIKNANEIGKILDSSLVFSNVDATTNSAEGSDKATVENNLRNIALPPFVTAMIAQILMEKGTKIVEIIAKDLAAGKTAKECVNDLLAYLMGK